MITLIISVLWVLKGSVKMEGRIVDELGLDIRRLALIINLVLIRCDLRQKRLRP